MSTWSGNKSQGGGHNSVIATMSGFVFLCEDARGHTIKNRQRFNHSIVVLNDFFRTNAANSLGSSVIQSTLRSKHLSGLEMDQFSNSQPKLLRT